MIPSDRHLLKQALTKDCIDSDEMIACWEGRAPQALATRLEEHRKSCAACEANWQLMVEFHTAEPTAAEMADVEAIVHGINLPAATTAPVAPSLWERLMAAATLPRLSFALAAMAIFGVTTMQWRASHPPELDPNGTSGQMRSVTTIAVIPAGDLSRVPQQVEWQSTPGASTYEVALVEVDGTQIWKTSLPGLSAAIPAEVQRQMVPHKTLIWQVTARNAAGEVIARSEPTRFRKLP